MDQDEDEIPTFDPQPLKNLIAIDEIESLAPIMDFKVHHTCFSALDNDSRQKVSCSCPLQVADMVKEETKQFLTLCGRGPRSSLRLLKHGLAVAEMADSPLPGNPNNIFTVRKNVADEYDSYIIVSFLNATLVLSIGDNVEEVKGTTLHTPLLSLWPLRHTELIAFLSLHSHRCRLQRERVDAERGACGR